MFIHTCNILDFRTSNPQSFDILFEKIELSDERRITNCSVCICSGSTSCVYWICYRPRISPMIRLLTAYTLQQLSDEVARPVSVELFTRWTKVMDGVAVPNNCSSFDSLICLNILATRPKQYETMAAPADIDLCLRYGVNTTRQCNTWLL